MRSALELCGGRTFVIQSIREVLLKAISPSEVDELPRYIKRAPELQDVGWIKQLLNGEPVAMVGKDRLISTLFAMHAIPVDSAISRLEEVDAAEREHFSGQVRAARTGLVLPSGGKTQARDAADLAKAFEQFAIDVHIGELALKELCSEPPKSDPSPTLS